MLGQAVSGCCHCRTVRFTATLSVPLNHAIKCTCSMCRMRGAVLLFAEAGSFAITAGEPFLTEYRFNTGIARHYFCRRCGIYTHHQRRFDINSVAINAACIAGLSPFDFSEVAVVDGANHPLDHGGGDLKVIGIARFDPDDAALALQAYRDMRQAD